MQYASGIVFKRPTTTPSSSPFPFVRAGLRWQQQDALDGGEDCPSFWGLRPPSKSDLSEKWDNNFFCSRSREIHLVGFRSFFLPWDSFQGREGRFFSRKTFSFKRSPPPPPYSVIVRDYPASSDGDTWDLSFSRFGKKMLQAPCELGNNYVRNIVTIPNPLALFDSLNFPLSSPFLVLIEFNAFSWI